MLTNLKRSLRTFAVQALGIRQPVGDLYNQRSEPAAIATYMDVERVHEVFAQAEAGDTRDLFALYRDIIVADNHIQTEIAKRKLAVLGDKLTVQPLDKADSADVAASLAVREMIDNCGSWFAACNHLLDASVYPVAVAEKVFAPAGTLAYVATAPLRFVLDRLVPVPFQLLDFSTGRLRIRDVDPQSGTPLGSTHEADPAVYIVHRGHLLTSADNFGGPLRSIVWWWLFSVMDRSWWARFMDRYGSPFIVTKYDASDNSTRLLLMNALKHAVKIGGLVVNTDTEVELVSAAATGASDAYASFHAICQREKSKLILGQTLSSEAQATGMNEGVSKIQENVRQDIRAFDAMRLATTLRDSLLQQYCAINGSAGRPPRLVWGSQSNADLRATADLLGSLNTAGLEVDDAALPTLSENVGLPLRRKAAPAAPPPAPLPFSVAADLLFGRPRARK